MAAATVPASPLSFREHLERNIGSIGQHAALGTFAGFLIGNIHVITPLGGAIFGAVFATTYACAYKLADALQMHTEAVRVHLFTILFFSSIACGVAVAAALGFPTTAVLHGISLGILTQVTKNCLGQVAIKVADLAKNVPGVLRGGVGVLGGGVLALRESFLNR